MQGFSAARLLIVAKRGRCGCSLLGMQVDQCSLQVAAKPACRNRKLTSNIHSSHDLNRSEAKRFRVKLTNLNISKIDLVETFTDLLEAENLEAKNLADEYPALMPADVAAVVDSPEFKSLRMNVLD